MIEIGSYAERMYFFKNLTYLQSDYMAKGRGFGSLDKGSQFSNDLLNFQSQGAP